MSKDLPRRELIAAVMRAVAAFQDSTDLVDEAAARRLGLNRTDLRLLGVLVEAGQIPIGELATRSGLSAGAATTAVDRLTNAGQARRVLDEKDRRRVMVEPTPTARTLVEEIWGPIGRESRQRLSRRSDVELRAILDFLHEGQKMQASHAARITERS